MISEGLEIDLVLPDLHERLHADQLVAEELLVQARTTGRQLDELERRARQAATEAGTEPSAPLPGRFEPSRPNGPDPRGRAELEEIVDTSRRSIERRGADPDSVRVEDLLTPPRWKQSSAASGGLSPSLQPWDRPCRRRDLRRHRCRIG